MRKNSRVRTIQSDVKLAVGNISCRISCSVPYCYRCESIHCKSWLTVGNYACDTNIVAERRWCPRDLFLKVVGLIRERCRTVLSWWRGHIWNVKKKKTAGLLLWSLWEKSLPWRVRITWPLKLLCQLLTTLSCNIWNTDESVEKLRGVSKSDESLLWVFDIAPEQFIRKS